MTNRMNDMMNDQMNDRNSDPALSRLLDMVGQADRDAAPSGMEARIAAAARPGPTLGPALRLTDAPPVVRVRSVARVLGRLAIAAAIGLAAVVTWFASQPGSSTPQIATVHPPETPVPTVPSDTQDSTDLLLALAFGSDSEREEISSLSTETDALGERVQRTISPSDAFLTDSSS
jgi:hypothetical protein